MKTWVTTFRHNGKIVTKQFKAETRQAAEAMLKNFDILTGPKLMKPKKEVK